MEISEIQMETKQYNNSTAKNFCKIVKKQGIHSSIKIGVYPITFITFVRSILIYPCLGQFYFQIAYRQLLKHCPQIHICVFCGFEYLYRNIELSSILSEEQDAFDNMPEGLQSSYRGMCSEDAIDNMEEASEKLDEVIELLGDIV